MSLTFSDAQGLRHISAPTSACFRSWQHNYYSLVLNLLGEGTLQQQGQAHELVTRPEGQPSSSPESMTYLIASLSAIQCCILGVLRCCIERASYRVSTAFYLKLTLGFLH